MTWAFVAGIGKRVLLFTIPIPVIAVLAAWAWVHFDKSSAIRRAVDRAVTELVDGAELDAARAQNEALRKILAETERRAERDRAAAARFSELLTAAEAEKDDLADEIADLESRPVNDACVVDGDLLERLRK